MQTHFRCKVDFADKVHPPIKDTGAIFVLGESPSSKVRIADYDPQQHKYVTVDRLVKAKVTERRGSIVIEGTSTHLRDTVGAEATLTVTVKPGQKCEDCG